ncbi:hypothetical protein ACFPER_05590 [Agromyces aurantiacus]|uniref:Uncharacterized protein n=1 Tax=Agromyces aurantiacus TaxID=165814 RepID=A0ABV9R2A5_9MICO|nr:hypothetical protein [Agromyces aurantiacus]MBM7502931.1 hypothetical protein [Agromyces aurantiacus]
MLIGILALIALPFLLLGQLIGWLVEVGDDIAWQERERKRRRLAAAEAELDRKQDELRQTILQLAGQLGADAHEARKALIRESYLATGRLPNRPE